MLIHGSENYEVFVYRPSSVASVSPNWADDALRVGLDEMVVDVLYSGKGNLSGLQHLIPAASDRGNKLLLAEPSRGELVSFLQVSLLFDPGQRLASETADDIAARFHELLGNASRRTSLESEEHRSVMAPHVECNCEFSFEPISEKELTSRLSALIPKLAPPLIGYGAIVSNHFGGKFTDDRLKWGHLTARHFGAVRRSHSPSRDGFSQG